MNIDRNFKRKLAGIGEVPKDWNIVRIEDVCEVIGGGTPLTRNEEYWNGNIPFATPTDVTKLEEKNENTLDSTESYITKEGLRSSSANLLPEDSVLLTSRATIGYGVINNTPLATNQGFVNLICNEKVHNLYLLYLMRFMRKRLESLASGSTYKEISRKIVKRLRIPLPSPSEQQKIALILSTVDDAIQKTNEIIQKSQELRKGLMQQLLTKGIEHREFKDTEIGKIPKDWKVAGLSDVTKFLTGHAFSSEYFDEKGIPLIRIRDLGKNNTETNYNGPYDGKYLVKKSDILVSMDGEFYVYLWEGSTGLLNQRVMKIWPENRNQLDDLYLFYALQKPLKLFEHQIGLTTVKHLLKDHLRLIRILLPPFQEQQKIAGTLSALDEKIKAEGRRKKKLKEMKKGLMQNLLTGKVRVN